MIVSTSVESNVINPNLKPSEGAQTQLWQEVRATIEANKKTNRSMFDFYKGSDS
jgi:hypothetical protein